MNDTMNNTILKEFHEGARVLVSRWDLGKEIDGTVITSFVTEHNGSDTLFYVVNHGVSSFKEMEVYQSSLLRLDPFWNQS